MSLDVSSINSFNMESITLDATDRRLLDALQRDASQTNQQLAADAHISPPTCLRRVLIVAVHDMPGYLALAQRLFTTDANVRNVKAFFSLKRAKFAPRVPLNGT